MAIEVMLVDDHPIVRKGIREVLSHESDIHIIAEASNGRDAVALVKAKKPDVVIMDITLPLLNGLDASRHIIRQEPTVKVLILSMHDNRAFIEKALSCGIKGYVVKESAADEIVQAIREVQSGRYFLSSRISSLVIEDYVARRKLRIKSTVNLTSRERDILQLIAEGLSNKEIASRLSIALKTVLVHRNNIMRKLNVHNQAQLIRYALKEGLISL